MKNFKHPTIVLCKIIQHSRHTGANSSDGSRMLHFRVTLINSRFQMILLQHVNVLMKIHTSSTIVYTTLECNLDVLLALKTIELAWSNLCKRSEERRVGKECRS